MPRKRKKKLSPEGQKLIDLGANMVSQVLQQGAVPEIVIGAKAGNPDTHEVTYSVVSPLEREKIRYVLSRVIRLLDGSIQENN